MNLSAPRFRIPKKYVLVIDRPDGALSDVAEVLKPLGFDVVRAATSTAALHHIETSPLLSLVAIFVDDARDTTDELTTELQRRGLRIPLVRAAAGDELTSYKLEREVGPLLREDVYSPWIMETLASAAELTFSGSFATPVSSDPPFLKANTVSLGAVRASIGFASAAFGGYTLVSGECDGFERMWQRMFGDAATFALDNLADMAGEICNQILGKMAPHLGTPLDPVKPTMPMLVVGPELIMRAKSADPTLIFPLRHGSELFYVSFCIGRCDLEGPVAGHETIESGELVFL